MTRSTRLIAPDDQNTPVEEQRCSVERACRGHIAGRREGALSLRGHGGVAEQNQYQEQMHRPHN